MNYSMYSNPTRDNRQHNLSIVFTPKLQQDVYQRRDDAEQPFFEVICPLVFDHEEIIVDFETWLIQGSVHSYEEMFRRKIVIIDAP